MTWPSSIHHFFNELRRGEIPNHTLVAKFGHNQAVGTSLEPICFSAVYQTPTTLTSLEIVSDDANDTAAGSGAQAVTIFGTGANWADVDETIELDGTTPVALANQYYRIWRVFVSRSGTYATPTTASQKGTLTIQVAGAGATWAQIGEIATGVGRGQSQIGWYTIEEGKTAIVYPIFIAADTNQACDLYFCQRPNADDITTPFTGTLRVVSELDAVTTFTPFPDGTVWGPFEGPCDIGWVGKTPASTASISVNFNIVLYPTGHKSHLI